MTSVVHPAGPRARSYEAGGARSTASPATTHDGSSSIERSSWEPPSWQSGDSCRTVHRIASLDGDGGRSETILAERVLKPDIKGLFLIFGMQRLLSLWVLAIPSSIFSQIEYRIHQEWEDLRQRLKSALSGYASEFCQPVVGILTRKISGNSCFLVQKGETEVRCGYKAQIHRQFLQTLVCVWITWLDL